MMLFCRIVSLFAAYLGFGFLYQRFVRGAKGVEQMPNYTFWRAFGNLAAVSHSFTLSIFYQICLSTNFFLYQCNCY